MKNLNVFFYAIYSNTSRNGGGLQYEAMLTSRDGIIEAAFEIFNDDEEGIKKFKEAAEGCNLSDRAEKLLS